MNVNEAVEVLIGKAKWERYGTGWDVSRDELAAALAALEGVTVVDCNAALAEAAKIVEGRKPIYPQTHLNMTPEAWMDCVLRDIAYELRALKSTKPKESREERYRKALEGIGSVVTATLGPHEIVAQRLISIAREALKEGESK